jgi:hypothetical protein
MMFDTQVGPYSGLLKRYVVQHISALTSPTSGERQPDNVDLRSRASSEVSDWSPLAPAQADCRSRPHDTPA